MANKQFSVKHGMNVQRDDGQSALDIAKDTGAMTVGHAFATNSTITSGGKLTVQADGADIVGMLDAQGGLQVTGGNLVVSNDLIVNGSTTTVNSTTVTIDDPIFTLGGDTEPTSDDNKDRGIEFRYYTDSAKLGFMGYDDSAGKFTFLTDATNNAEVFSGTTATIVANMEGNADTATRLAAAGTINLQAGDINAVSASSDQGNYDLTVTIANNAITLGKMAQLADMKVIGNVSGGAADPAAISIESDMASGVSASHDSLASAKTIKAYVDQQISSANALSELDEVTIDSAAAGDMLMYHDGQWRDVAMSGDVTITSAGVTTIGAGTVHNTMMEHDSVSFGGVEVELGASSAQPAFDLTNATNYPTSSLTGTITNAQLAGSIANDKLAGSISNDKLAGGITNDKLVNKSVSFGGISLNLGENDDTPAFDLADATNYPTSSLVGSITNAQLAGSIASTKIAELDNFDTGDVSEGSNLYFTQARARGSVSHVDAGGDGSFSYDSGTGAFTYTGPSAAETRAHFSVTGDKGLSLTDGAFELIQSIKTDATPTFAGITITGNLNVAGTTTTVNSATMEVEDSLFLMAKNNGANLTDIGFAGAFNDGSAKFAAFFRDASDGKWKLAETTQNNISTSNSIDTGDASYAKSTLVADLEGDVTGTVSSIANHDTDALNEGSTNLYFTDARVRLNRLDQMAAPAADVSMTSGGTAQKITGMADGVDAQDAVTKAQLDAVSSQLNATDLNALTDVSLAAEADAQILVYQAATSDYQNKSMSGDVTMAASGAMSIGANKVTDAMIQVGGLANASLAQSSVSFGGVSLALGETDATPAFNLEDATGLPTTSLTGTITNAQLAGSIANDKLVDIENSKLVNSTVGFGGVTLSLGQTDDTPAFDLSDATSYPTSSLVGTITNAQLAGSIANDKLVDIANSKLVHDSVTVAGKEVELGASISLEALTSASAALTMSGDFDGANARTVTLSLHDNEALEVGASGLDLKDTIAGARTFSEEVTASAGVDVGDAAVFSGNHTMVAAAEEVADEFSATLFRSAKYVVQVTNAAGNEYQCSELLIIHDGVTASCAEYGVMYTGASALASFDVDVSGGKVRVKATAGANDELKLSRTCLKA